MPNSRWTNPERDIQTAFRVVNRIGIRVPAYAEAGMARSTSFAQSETP